MERFKDGPIPHSTLLESETAGETIAISGLMHGNELVGLEVVKALAEIEILKGKLLLIIGNPEAKEKQARYLEQDLNWSADPQKITEARQAIRNGTANHEQARIIEIVDCLDAHKPDILIDIHNTRLPSAGFAIGKNDNAHQEIMAELSYAEAVFTHGDGYVTPVLGVEDYARNQLGATAFTYETGGVDAEHFETTVCRITQEMKNLLVKRGLLPATDYADFEPVPKQHYELFQAFIPEKDFEFAVEVQNFKSLKKGQTMGYMGEEVVLVPEDCYMIFPKGQTIQAGSLACELARRHNVISLCSASSRSDVSQYRTGTFN